jgi:hypothetical protein
MHVFIIVLVIISVALWIVFKNIRQKNKNSLGNDNKDTMEIHDEKIEMENIFINEVKKGEKACKLMDVYDQMDLMFVKSLFQSEQIPYKIEFEHGSTIYAGSPTIETAVYILEKDHEDAIKIIEEYDKTKLQNIKLN